MDSQGYEQYQIDTSGKASIPVTSSSYNCYFHVRQVVTNTDGSGFDFTDSDFGIVYLGIPDSPYPDPTQHTATIQLGGSGTYKFVIKYAPGLGINNIDFYGTSSTSTRNSILYLKNISYGTD